MPGPVHERRYTIMVVPEGGRGEVRQMEISLKRLRRWLVVGVLGVVAAIIGLGALAFGVPGALANRDIVDENVAMKARLQDIERTLDEVDASMRRLRFYDTQLQEFGAGASVTGGLDGLSSRDAELVGWEPAQAGEGEPRDPEGTDAAVDPVDPLAPASPDTGDDTGAEQGSLLPAGAFERGAEPDVLEAAPSELSAGEAWAYVLQARARRSLALLRHILPEAGRLVETAADYRAMRGAMPSIWPVNGTYTSSFGYRRSPFNKRWKFHAGADVAAPPGTWVVAPGPGVVVRAEWHSAYGRVLEIDHGYGVVSRLAHNSRLYVGVGDRVARGQVVAAVGSTGRVTGPHVHYEVLLNGEQVDPLLYLPAPD